MVMAVSGRVRPWGALAAVVVAAVAGGAAGARAQVSFLPLGDLPGGQFYSEAWGVSGDGSTVVGASIVNGNILFGGTFAAFRWRSGMGLEDIHDLGGIGTVCRAYAVNQDGRIVVGSADYGALQPTQMVAFVWREELGAVEIGDLPGGPSGSARGAARGVSSEGLVIAGSGESDSGAEPFRYTLADSAFLGLGDLPGGAFGGAGYGISGDGGTIVGSSITDLGTEAFRWTQAEGMVRLGSLPVAAGVTAFAEAYAASADGTVIVGLSRSVASGNNGWEAFRWTQGGGMVGLGDLPGGAVLSAAYAVTADGSVVVGKGGVAGPCSPFGCTTASRAVIWDAQNGLRDLNTVLTGLGVNLGAWVLTEARGISADGRVIVGTGTNPDGNTEAWRVELGPPPCRVDMDHNGAIEPADIALFVGTWVASLAHGTLAGDFDGNTVVEPADIASFVNEWFGALSGGC